MINRALLRVAALIGAMAFAGAAQAQFKLTSPDIKPGGTAIVPEGVRFRLWAPAANRVEVGVGADDNITWHDMPRDVDGWCERIIGDARAGLRYRYRIDGATCVPDPASRYNPDDVHG